MRYYHRDIRETCSEVGCSKPATHEVRDGMSGPIRRCCLRHADALVKHLNGA